MPLPPAFGTVTIVEDYVDFTGAVGTGTVTFIPVANDWLDMPGSNTIIVPKPITVGIDANGHMTITVPLTDDPDVVPTYTYSVTENVSGLSRTRTIEVPSALLPGPLVLSDLAPTNAGSVGTTALTKAEADAFYAPIGGAVDTSALLAKANNLSDVPNKATARTNLGLGTASTQPTSAFDAAGAAAAEATRAAAVEAKKVDKWAASTSYTAGQYVLNPSGQIVSANATFTSAATYSAANWTVVSGGGAAQTGVTTVASSGATQTLTLPAGSDAAYDVTLTANCTLTPSGGTVGKLQTLTIILRQDATAGRAVTFPPIVAWPGQVTPSFNLTVGKYDVVQLTTVDGGTTWIGALVASAVQPVTAPPAPISLAVSPTSTQNVLTWAPAGTGGSAITGYKVYRSTSAGTETLLTTLGNVTTYTDTGLTNGTTYYYKVTALNALGESAQSAEIAAAVGHYLNVTTGGASTPNLAGQAPGTGTIDIRALVQMASWVPTGNNFIVAKWHATAANNQYALYVDNAGKLNLAWYNTGGVFQGVASSVPLNQSANATKWVRGLANVGAGTITYYTSDDGVTWTQLGTTITGLTTTAVQTPAAAQNLTLGQTASATAQFAGRIYKAQVLIAGSQVNGVDYTTATAGAGTVTGTQAETWTTIAPAAVV